MTRRTNHSLEYPIIVISLTLESPPFTGYDRLLNAAPASPSTRSVPKAINLRSFTNNNPHQRETPVFRQHAIVNHPSRPKISSPPARLTLVTNLRISTKADQRTRNEKPNLNHPFRNQNLSTRPARP